MIRGRMMLCGPTGNHPRGYSHHSATIILPPSFCHPIILPNRFCFLFRVDPSSQRELGDEQRVLGVASG